jgi:DNA-binding transcriptional MerR regulator
LKAPLQRLYMETLTKRYYTIREVAEMIKVHPQTLRQWEKEFPHIKPKRTQGGDRQYRPEDVELVREISYLLYEKNLKLEGAKEHLKAKKKQHEEVQQLIESLEKVKGFLSQLRESLDDN